MSVKFIAFRALIYGIFVSSSHSFSPYPTNLTSRNFEVNKTLGKVFHNLAKHEEEGNWTISVNFQTLLCCWPFQRKSWISCRTIKHILTWSMTKTFDRQLKCTTEYSVFEESETTWKIFKKAYLVRIKGSHWKNTTITNLSSILICVLIKWF